MARPIDIAAQVSPQLSALVDDLLKDPDIEEPITLGLVRQRLAGGLLGEMEQLEQLHPDSEAGRTLLGELDALIEEFTEDAPAIDFVAAKASEPLSRVIEAVMNDPNTPQRPTLEGVRDALLHGSAARLEGEGALESDEDKTLLAEIDALIERFGSDALAEHLIRYE
jgi:hypothetical protein